MKKATAILSILILCSCRMGDFTMVSTKNISSTENTVLLESGVVKKAFSLDGAIDACIESEEGGMYLQNVVLYEGFIRYKVKADVWGVKPE
jgi:hypothetical protein